MKQFRELTAVAVPLPRANIDTDQIVPARYLQKPRSADFAPFLFRDVRNDVQGGPNPDFPVDESVYAGARIVVAGANFGCGSSREHAVWALDDGGFRALIAPSFGDIFHSTALKNGLLPIRQDREIVDGLLAQLQRSPGATITIDLVSQTFAAPDGTRHAFAIDAFPRHCLLEGLDEIDYTLTQLARIEAFEEARTGAPGWISGQ